MSTEAVRGKPPRPASLGSKIDSMFELRDKKRVLEASIKDLDTAYAKLEAELIEEMGKQGVDKLSGTLASASITKTVTANVEDWDMFLAYVYKTKQGHLLQRRVSDPAFRELLDHGKKVPGTQPFIKARLNVRVR